ncbi:hypothetical protein KIW84_UN0724 [Lathyrus oleraceus]|nr:hypothetical protein KIW84_UN0724 [Pisum sativum]
MASLLSLTSTKPPISPQSPSSLLLTFIQGGRTMYRTDCKRRSIDHNRLSSRFLRDFHLSKGLCLISLKARSMKLSVNDQRAGSQEHENSSRRFSSLPRPAFSKDESQPHNSRSSSNLLVKWNSVDNKNQLSEGLENRIGIMETSLSRFAMIMDSVQSDVMQVNKGTKEINLEMECIRQKLIAQDNSLQLMMRGQEELKASINESLKSVSEQMSHVTNIEKLQEVYMLVSAMPQLIEGSMRNLQNDLQKTTKEMQEISRSLKHTNQKDLAQSILSPKCVSKQFITPKLHQRSANEAKMNTPAIAASKQTQPHTEKTRGARDCAIVIESDEETDGKFSCVVKVNADLFGNLSREEEEEAERILRNARRRKRRRNSMVTIL